jgi:hypothetical protein
LQRRFFVLFVFVETESFRKGTVKNDVFRASAEIARNQPVGR